VILAVLDGNVLDYLADHPDDVAVVEAARDSGRVKLLATHILRDELDAIESDGEKWARLEAVRGRLGFEEVATRGFVLDVSWLDKAQLTSWPEVDEFAQLSVGNPKHAQDALLALTAKRDGAVLVTADKGLTGRARALGIEVLDPAGFVGRLR
jgi:rRNA-processing protein FCF1